MKKQWILWLASIGVLLFVVMALQGATLFPNKQLEKQYGMVTMIDTQNVGNGEKIFLAQTDTGYVSGILTKTKALWTLITVLDTVTSNNEGMRTIATIDYQGNKYLAVATLDQKVNSVEMVSSGEQVSKAKVTTKQLQEGAYTVFTWQEEETSTEAWPPEMRAYGENGEALYYYGYPSNNGSITNAYQLRWYAIEPVENLWWQKATPQ